MTSDTYYLILQTARRLFIQQGYTATSMRQIAAETGIGKATIYHHFTDKQAILAEMLNQYTNPSVPILAGAASEPDPRRRIELVTRASLKFFYENADLLQLVRREVPALRRDLTGAYTAFFKSFFVLLQEAIQQGIAQGIFRPVEPAHAARILITLIQGTFAGTFIQGDAPLKPDEATLPLLDIYFQGINRR
jgi:TetR/AcrR family transcriptional regulator, cholesterol catabolism regulator